MTSLVGETRKAAQEGVYLIERAAEAVLAVLRYDDGRQIMTTPPSLSRRRGWGSSATDVYTMVDGGGLRKERNYERRNYERKPKQKHGVVD